MKRWLGLSAGIDRFTVGIGKLVSWLTLFMVVIAAYNAVVRYIGRFIGQNLSSNAYIEAQWYLFSLIFLLGAAYALQQDAHVRVDVLFSRFSQRARTWINLLGTFLLLIPFCVFLLVVSWPVVANSWSVREGSPDPGGLPRWPLKAVIPLCFVLLVVQGVSEAIKEIARLRGLRPTTEEHHAEGV
ncbi:MAG: TRAP transporter small permease subunit [Gemmatimonadetes bacterium]|nr:TRAP transporter small permease subunit [Gemmatimonadota bacterium]